MATIGEALYARLRDASSGIYGVGDAIAYGLDEYGSMSEFAREVGIPRTTLRRWAAGGKSGARGQSLLESMREEAGASVDELADMGDVELIGKYGYRSAGGFVASDTMTRTVRIGDYLQPSTGERLVDAFNHGADAEQLHKIFADGINDGGFYARTMQPDSPTYDAWEIDALDGWG